MDIKALGATKEQLQDIRNRVIPYIEGLDYLEEELKNKTPFNYDKWAEITWARNKVYKKQEETTIIP